MYPVNRMKVTVVMQDTVATVAKADLGDLFPAVLFDSLVKIDDCWWKSIRYLAIVAAKYVNKMIPTVPHAQNGILQPHACDSIPVENVAIARPKSPVAP